MYDSTYEQVALYIPGYLIVPGFMRNAEIGEKDGRNILSPAQLICSVIFYLFLPLTCGTMISTSALLELPDSSSAIIVIV